MLALKFKSNIFMKVSDFKHDHDNSYKMGYYKIVDGGKVIIDTTDDDPYLLAARLGIDPALLLGEMRDSSKKEIRRVLVDFLAGGGYY